MQQRSLQQVRVSVSLIFLIHGLIIATWASRIPAFQAHLHLSPAVLGRSLMMAAIGSVLAMPAAGWLINKFGSLSIVIGSTLGFGLALPLIAESNTVLTLSVALLFYGRASLIELFYEQTSKKQEATHEDYRPSAFWP